MMSTQKMNLDRFLKGHVSQQGGEITHTKIGDRTHNIPGGAYTIQISDNKTLMDVYYQEVFDKGRLSYLTEKQQIEGGPILIDIDLRYELDITKRQHKIEHIQSFVSCYMDEVLSLLYIPPESKIDIYVMEKQDVNRTDKLVKDGIHIVIGIGAHKAIQCMLRTKLIEKLPSLWNDIPLKPGTEWDDVFDEGVTKGCVNWQMYGSRKPHHMAYMIKYKWIYTLNNQVEWEPDYSFDITTFNTYDHLNKLSARYNGNPVYNLRPEHSSEYEKHREMLVKKKVKRIVVSKPSGEKLPDSSITSMEMLDKEIDNIFDGLSDGEYIVKETHGYTMALPKSYYGPGSYTKWIRVGWALANTDKRLFATWVKFSAQPGGRTSLLKSDGTFDWSRIGELKSMWDDFEFSNKNALSYRSIIYWAKNESPEAYGLVRRDSIQYYIDHTIKGVVTEWDIANVLYHICKDRFVCASISKNIWYEFVDHKWTENDSGNSLRLCISSTLFEEYNSRANSIRNKVQMMEQTNPMYEKLVDVPKKLDAVATLLKKTTWKSNIMREARELFYDSTFMDRLDCNPWLLCFNNGVVDFKEKCFRRGHHDDYLSKSTLRDYIPLDSIKDNDVARDEVKKFFDELFPIESLRDYMWQHLASILIGINPNQTFNVYIGSGRNGKSCLVELMSLILGELKATIPITLVTSKRNTIGSTSSEVAQLKGIRYAVMQEPSKGDRINEGILKEITGGDPIQARALYKDTVTFIPQFTLVVCTNVLFELNSTDDGTLRRFRLCDFKSKFIDNPYEDEIRFPKNVCPYQFKLDKNLSAKFKRWVPLITAQLVELAFVRQAKVDDCDIVMRSTERYRESQDYLSEFAKENIVCEEGTSLKKMELYNVFKDWYTTNYGRSIPKSKEVYEFMNIRYGHYNGSWKNIKISYDEDED